jgi:tetratricopeptide (TPR) repeat protein
MTRRALCLLVPVFAWLLTPAHAGEIIRFDVGPQARSDVVLANVPVKALVAEFLDPGNTGLGRSVGYLAWREILTAISDQAGAGVILARSPGDRRLTDLLEQAYHEAAVRIAREQSASMAVWGAVNAAGDDVYISTYLSILPQAARMELKLRLVGEPPLPAGLEAGVERTNFNFPPVETTRAQLFQRSVVTRQDVLLRAAADASSQPVARALKAKALVAVDMEKGWFKVRLADGRFAYLDNSMVDVPPRTVDARVTIGLAKNPAARPGARITLDGSYQVLDMRYVERKGLWYELAVNDTRGWVPASQVYPRFSLPMVHFVAGLYRYQFKRYDDARREFTQYATAPESAADNASLATAYQLTGASMLLAESTIFEASPAALEEFSKAVTVTPYDPSAYSLRALSTLALRRQAGLALVDLEQAFRLDPANATAARIIGTLARELKSDHGTLKWLLTDSREPTLRVRLDDLARRYPADANVVP